MKATQHVVYECLLLYALVSAAACVAGPKADIEPVYDKRTGKLQLLKYDSDKNGKVDTWSHMDGTRVLRIEIDNNEDGKIDRWEYYDTDQKLEKTGTSRANDGREDAWLYSAADGSLARVDVSTRRNGKANRIEYYEKNALVRAEEDSDEDDKVDKWEVYAAGRLASVAFDTIHRGLPDRRLVYGADGSARLEVDPEGTGRFVEFEPPAAQEPLRQTILSQDIR